MPKIQQHGAGTSGRGRRGRGAHVATSLSEINVVPLVDVMLVLLIIFMVTAPMLQQGLEVNLPKATRAKPVNAQPVYVSVPADFSRTRVVQVDRKSESTSCTSWCGRPCSCATTSQSTSAPTVARACRI